MKYDDVLFLLNHVYSLFFFHKKMHYETGINLKSNPVLKTLLARENQYVPYD